MSVSIKVDPTSGNVNVFGYGVKNEVILKREDLAIVGVGEGINGYAEIEISSNPGIIVGDYIYLGSGIYDISGKVTDISGLILTVDFFYVQNEAGGYINYKKDYYVEYKYTSISNELENLLGYTIKNDGTNSGIINLDLTLPNDLNSFETSIISKELKSQRIKYSLYYREVWRNNTANAYTKFTNDIIILNSYENPKQDEFALVNDITNIWLDYDIGVYFIRSDILNADKRISVYFDEKNNNKISTIIGISLKNFNEGDIGQLFVNFKNIELQADTEYISISSKLTNLADYLIIDYSGIDYKI